MKSNYQWSKVINDPLILDQNTELSQLDSEDQIMIEALIESFVETKRSSQTRRAYARDVRDFVGYAQIVTVWDLQRYPIGQLSHQILDRSTTIKKYDSHHIDKIINPSTVNRKVYAVSSWFEYLMAVYQYPKNPAKIFTPYKTTTHSTTESLTRPEYVSMLHYQKDQYVQILYSDDTPPLSLVKELRDYLLLAMMGMSLRRNEVVKLRWSDIDHTTPHLSVYQKWWSIKLIPLPSSIYQLLVQLWDIKDQAWLKSDYLFTPISNHRTWDLTKPISSDYVFELVKRLAMLCDIDKKITPHSLRKTFIELALDSKEDYINIANATGHSTLEMIKYYDTRSKLEKNAINGMWDVFD